jgi:hypothetical protein
VVLIGPSAWSGAPLDLAIFLNVTAGQIEKSSQATSEPMVLDEFNSTSELHLAERVRATSATQASRGAAT